MSEDARDQAAWARQRAAEIAVTEGDDAKLAAARQAALDAQEADRLAQLADRQAQLTQQAEARRQLGDSAGVLLPVGLAVTAAAALLAQAPEARADTSPPLVAGVTQTATGSTSRDLGEGLQQDPSRPPVVVTLPRDTPGTPNVPNGPGSPRTRPPSVKR